MTNKKSIRFYNDHKVRAIWSEEENKWYFSATDIIAAINDEQDYVKAGNYWRWLKKKLASQGIQPVSATHDFKFQAPDGKMRRYAPKLFGKMVPSFAVLSTCAIIWSRLSKCHKPLLMRL